MSKIDEKMLYAEIGRRVHNVRKNAELTQSQLADLLEVERTSITNIESGNQRASLHFVYSLCLQLKVELGMILPPVTEILSEERTPKDVEVQVGAVKEKVSKDVANFIEGVEKGKI
jgi:transcriptional regulator with XRE-family HTH domain